MAIGQNLTDISTTKVPAPRVIAGFGRSGTTWVQDVIAQSNCLRAVFEPLHPGQIGGADAFAHRYVPADSDEEDLYRFLYKFMHGRYHSLWADYRVVATLLRPMRHNFVSSYQIRRYLKHWIRSANKIGIYWNQRRYDRRIVKFVRANMMLGWIKSKFDARIVFMIRHPVPVILSQLKSPRAWKAQDYIVRYRADARLLDAIGDDLRTMLFRDLSDTEGLALCWCIENTIALRQAEQTGIAVIYYEKLLDQGRPQWQRILTALDLDVLPKEDLIRKPSQQTWGEKSKNVELLRKHAAWMDRLDQPTATGIQSVLDAAGVSIYRVSEALPVTDGAEFDDS